MIFVLVGFAKTARAVEPWADPKLDVRDGLLMWLDASRQPAAAEAMKAPSPANGAKVDRWFDGSGSGLHVSAANDGARPTYRVGERDGRWPPAFYFDGRDDAVVASTDRQPLKNATVVIVAAPQAVHQNFNCIFSAAPAG
jgi:hypothetical protein